MRGGPLLLATITALAAAAWTPPGLAADAGPSSPAARATQQLRDRMGSTRGTMLTGVGDRVTLYQDGEWRWAPDAAGEAGLRPDLFQVWLPRGWSRSWVDRDDLLRLAASGQIPVLMHYFHGDLISAERFGAERDAWYADLWELTQLVRIDSPVLVVLAPEFNNAPPPGETALTDAAWFSDDLRAAARMIRKQAPNALVGVCPGDFSPTRNLERSLSGAARDLDFIAFQEMRADTDALSGTQGYLDVGQAALEYASYLHDRFRLPVLLAYVAVSSHGGWEEAQARALRSVLRRRKALRSAGVFGTIYFQLRDDPEHRGYFGPAERHFGLTRRDGSPKPALEVFRALGAREPALKSR